MKNLNLTILSAALFLTMSTGAMAATMTKAEYKEAKNALSATYKKEQAACKPLKGNAKDICVEEAKGREKVGKAELEANFAPSDKHQYDVRMAKAEADYAVAKEKCDDLSGNAKDVCRKEAKAAFVTAKANAKVTEKSADANATAREKSSEANAKARKSTADARKDASTEKRDAEYAVAKEKCEAYSGDAKTTCVNEAKARFGQN
jgi:hypothetical protein